MKSRYWIVAGMFVACFTSIVLSGNPALAQDSKDNFGGIEPGKWVLGMRAGFAPVTQQLSGNTATDVGSLVNFQAMYSLNRWLLVGMMLEWERHSVDQERPQRDLGHQDTVSVLPTVELRPTNFGSLSPYVNMLHAHEAVRAQHGNGLQAQ
ncbi:MAG: hypothetical protein EBU84_21500 [Actinobacteria bacterium]|nr:hypothetical protein [Actinomycetota bacterium]